MKATLPLATLASALAVAAATVKTGIYTEISCSTIKGPKSIMYLSTKTYDIKETYTIESTVIVQPTKIVTPKPKTTTLTTTKVITTQKTESPITKTSKIETTSIETKTVTSISTETTSIWSYTTTTEQPPPTVVDTLAGFIPIQSSLPGAALVGDVGIPSEGEAEDKRKRGFLMSSNDKRVPSSQKKGNSMYPQRVVCQYKTHIPKIITRTKTISPTTITASGSTLSVLKTSTITAVSTIFPDDVVVKVTTTVTSTSIDTETSVTTSTHTIPVTHTVTLPQATSYKQCNTDNFANRYNNDIVLGTSTNEAGIGSAQVLSFDDAKTPYGCCNYCAQIDGCLGGSMSSNGWCFLIFQSPITCETCYGTVFYGAIADGYTATIFNGRPGFAWSEIIDRDST